MNFKSKYEIGSLVKYKCGELNIIGEITSIEFSKKDVVYYVDQTESHCFESEIIESYAIVPTRKKRSAKTKKLVDVIV